MAFRSACCCGSAPINEDNARFLLLALFIVVYLLCGAAVFSALEQPKEREAKERWAHSFELFRQTYNLSQNELHRFLRNYEEANVAGIRVDSIRPRWDFTGAFYFVGTVVSTIGFGMTTPATTGGKVFLMFYGLLGCAATILFFNLFLERVITVIAVVLKSCHEHRRNKAQLPQNGQGVRARSSGKGEDLAGWKPSVYCVMFILGAAAVLVSCCASLMYSAAEGWSYLDSLYFCFVAFSTIGFGDMVLNWLLRRLEATCRCCYSRGGHHPHRHPRRNVVAPGHLRARSEPSIETDAINESETDAGRRMSGEMISMRDFLAANKVNLAIMQKQLSEMAIGNPRQSGSTSHHNGFSGGVGALGIMNNRLAETSVDR
ncbi:potassium channel subfamily K member 13-like isoform X3 [Syngnathoides biaculeatus]|uniref:potassium channel subfamily K member 13-like isoform X3 n=1 Tax=Syngnathoides biaculeatus TaxID=300417 RepID=UPI002ADD6B3A|nr:potassium channel subfamily K member 13-like isoform X3 [Syngnathoides biaculeatus]